MGFLIDEKKFINDNIFKYEERMNTQYSRFLDKSPTFVTYYHINNIESITDRGFLNVERIIGSNSPIRFKKITDFPVYGLESILLSLSDEEQGLDVSYESELIILTNTIKPLPNDCFKISYLNKDYLFMVSEVNYDTIKSNNYYKINFYVRSLSDLTSSALEKQIDEKYNCILTNIGTQEKCLIKEEDYELIKQLNSIYNDIALKYKKLFYNIKYNNFLFVDVEKKIYDKFLSNFINKNKLFCERYNYDTLYLADEDNFVTFEIEYEKSLFRVIEKCDKEKIKQIKYTTVPITDITSIFNYYRDSSVRSVRFNDVGDMYIDNTLIEKIINGNNFETEGIAYSMIINYFNNTVNSIYNLELNKLRSYDYMDYTYESFVLVPIILYIIRYYYNKFMAIN